MYKVLLVDDEPLVLSGIKFLIDWNQLNCTITHTARNGKQAFELIVSEKPDIVVCDINMPVMTGLEVLKAVSDMKPIPAFIMLTNHQEFDMARESLQYKAVDYLLKTQLEPDVLKGAVKSAIEECEKRKSMTMFHQMNAVIEEDKTRMLHSCLQNLLKVKSVTMENESYRVLEDNRIFDCYCLIEMILDYSVIPDYHRFNREDRERIFAWEHELLETIVSKLFSSYELVIQDGQHQKFLLFLWDLTEENFQTDAILLHTKLKQASASVTPAKISLLVGGIQKGNQIMEAVRQLDLMDRAYYNQEQDLMIYHKEKELLNGQGKEDVLKIQGDTGKLILAIKSKNMADCKEYLTKIQETFGTNRHEKKEGLSALIDLYSSVCTVYATLAVSDLLAPFFVEIAENIQEIQQILTLRELLFWLKDFEERVLIQLEQLTCTNSEIIEKVRGYIVKHMQEKLILSEIAAYINVSPGYLSALFKKHSGQNLIDYVNEIKMQRACELIREGRYKMYEISCLLSFENAYYFTKVFKKYIGMTPKEYQNKVKRR